MVLRERWRAAHGTRAESNHPNARGSDVDSFKRIRRNEDVLLRGVELQTSEALGAEVRRRGLLSANAKCSVSLDFPVGATCSPTAVCATHCYAIRSGAPSTWTKSLRKRLRTHRFFTTSDAIQVVERLERDFRKKQRHWARRGSALTFLRVCGTGDLFPEAVPVLNLFAQRNPDVRVWIVTRRVDLAERLEPSPNLYLQLSLDRSTPSVLVERARDLVRQHPRAYLSFLRTRTDDDTLASAIVFNEKGTRGLPFDGSTDCPVDAGRLALGNVRGQGGDACARCGKCFDVRTLDRQQLLLNTARHPRLRVLP